MGAPYKLSLVEEEDVTLLYAEKDGVKIILFKFMADGTIHSYAEDMHCTPGLSKLQKILGPTYKHVMKQGMATRTDVEAILTPNVQPGLWR